MFLVFSEVDMDDNCKELPSELMAKPCLSWNEFWQGLLGLPDSTAVLVAQEMPMPKFFMLGRRRYIRAEDAAKWLEARSEAAPYFPRRNKRSA